MKGQTLSSEEEGSKLHMIQRQQVQMEGQISALCDSLNRWASASETRAAALEKAIEKLHVEVRGQGDYSGIKTDVARLENRVDYLENSNRKMASQLESIKQRVWMAVGASMAVGGGAGVLFGG